MLGADAWLRSATVRADPTSEVQLRREGRFETTNVSVLSVGFMAIFAGFSVCQNTATTMDRRIGSISLSILYMSFALGNLFSGFIVSRIGCNRSLIYASFFFVAFCYASIDFNTWLLYPSATICGFAAAIEWTAQAGILLRCGEKYSQAMRISRTVSLAAFQGLFFSIYQTAPVLGNMAAFILMFNFHSRYELYLAMTAITALGILLLIGVWWRLPESHMTGYLGDSFVCSKSRSSSVASIFSVSHVDGWSQSSSSRPPTVIPSTQIITLPTAGSLTTDNLCPNTLNPNPTLSQPTHISSTRNPNPNSIRPSHSPPHEYTSLPSGHTSNSEGKTWNVSGNREGPSLSLSMTREREGGRRRPQGAQTLRMLYTNGRLRWMMLLAMYNGLSLAFSVGEYPLFIQDESVRYLALSLTGLSSLISSHVLSCLSKRASKQGLVLVGLVLHGAIYGLLLSSNLKERLTDVHFIFVGVVFGCGDSVMNTQTYGVVSKAFQNSTNPAFGATKLFQALAASAYFFFHSYLSFVKTLSV